MNEIIQQAVKLKTAQQHHYRTEYETWPVYYQHSLFISQDEQIQQLHENDDFKQKMDAAMAIKDKGNAFYASKDYPEAGGQYEKAMAIFKYVITTDKEWKTQGIRDDFLIQREYEAKNQDEAAQIEQLMISCYLNTAMSKIKEQQFSVVIAACNDVLALDPHNTKALYRRAIARITPISAGGLEYDLAIQDLETAVECDPSDRVLRSQWKTLLKDRQHQKKRDKKQFSGMFNRGTICTAEEEARSKMSQERVNEPVELSDFDRQIREADIAVRAIGTNLPNQSYDSLLTSRGEYDEAKQLRKKIEIAKDQHNKNTLQPEELDFYHPTPQMIDDAKEKGIDLTDPVVQKMLQDMQNEKLSQCGNETMPKGKGFRPSAAAADPAGVIVSSMNEQQLAQLLRAEGVDVSDQNLSHEQMKILAKEILISKGNGQARTSEQESTTNNILTWKVTISLVSIWFFYRLYSLGIFGIWSKSNSTLNSLPMMMESDEFYHDDF